MSTQGRGRLYVQECVRVSSLGTRVSLCVHPEQHPGVHPEQHPGVQAGLSTCPSEKVSRVSDLPHKPQTWTSSVQPSPQPAKGARLH